MMSLSWIQDLVFANKEFFWLFLLLPFLLAWHIYSLRKKAVHYTYSSLSLLGLRKSSLKAKWRHSVLLLRMFTYAAIIVVLARPQSRSSWKDSKKEGIDIVLSMDVSFSMLARDFKPDRMAAARDVAIDFIDGRENDNIGLVVFSGTAFTQCPLTTDHKVVKNLLKDIEAGMLPVQGTAIGLGLATAVDRLSASKAKSKVLVLLSDGVNNAGEIDPVTAGEIAKTYGVRVYCIGVGTKGKALTPTSMLPNGELMFDYVEVEIDEKMMQEVASSTGGKYFRATDKASLVHIYKEIDKLEKTIIEEKSFSNKEERFFPFALAAVIALLLEFILKFFIFKTLT